MKVRNTIFIALCLVVFQSIAQNKKDSIALKFANTITAADLKEHLYVLASDEYEGRETGQKGQKMAAEYIAKYFESIGLTPVDKEQNYLQEFDLLQKTFLSSSISNAKIKGELYTNFYFYGLNNVSLKNEKLVFAGYGIDDKNYSNYTDIDVKGKVVVMYSGEPFYKFKSLITKSFDYSEWGETNAKKIKFAYEKGAKCVLIVSDRTDDEFEMRAQKFEHRYEKPALYQMDKEFEKTAFYVSQSFMAKLFGVSLKKVIAIKSKLDKKANAVNKIKSSQITIELNIEDKKLATENVLGMVQGTDKGSEIITISAHYDHIGIRNGIVYNGADDDGSGTVTVMELAQAFAEAKKAGYGPRRSILFMGFTGEEKGLLGSQYYSNNPIFELKNTVTNLNIDMIGRLDENHPDNENYVYLIGTNMLSQDLHDISEKANTTYKSIELDYRFNSLDDPNHFYYRSDHYNFAKHGVPCIFYFNGVHEDYHKATDTVDKILFNKIENIAQLVFFTAWEIANREERPQINKIKE